MPEKRYIIAALIIAVLLLANLISFIFSDWGLITVRAHGKPLAQIIKSIEWQGGVTIYTNIDPTTPISMEVVKVPLAEAMESLAANIPPPDNGGGNGPPGGAGGPPGGGGQGGGRRGFGGGAQWKLGFFAAPTSAQVKQEIRTFQGGGGDDDLKIYSYPTRLQMLASDSEMPAADPRLQVWSGVKPPPPAPPPAADGSSSGDTDPPAPPSTIQDYLDAVAEGADVWIMSPSTWENKITNPPDPGISVAKAVKSLVSHARGSVEQALVLYTPSPGQRGGGGGGRGFMGGDTGWSHMQDRLRNAINGLPPEARSDALSHLAEESKFQDQLKAAPPDERRNLVRSHFMSRIGTMDNWRRSPERRAQMYQRAVSNRQSAMGKS